MGTRAMITKNGKPFIATHWDGYLRSLGLDLFINPKLDEDVIKVAKSHTIDSADRKIRKALNDERVKKLSEKFNLTEEEIRKGLRRGDIIGAGDYEIGSIGYYDDFAQYQYDLRADGWHFRRVHHTWKSKDRKEDEWQKLTIEACLIKH